MCRNMEEKCLIGFGEGWRRRGWWAIWGEGMSGYDYAIMSFVTILLLLTNISIIYTTFFLDHECIGA